MHIHNRRNARARKAAACGIGRNHFANLSVFGNHDARKGRADGAIVHGLLGYGDARFGRGHLLLGERNFGLQTVRSRPGVVEGLLGLDAGLLELLSAVQPDLAFLSCTS